MALFAWGKPSIGRSDSVYADSAGAAIAGRS